ncbi:conserved exported hypothetical protein [Magnetospirillum sp. LM-5]|uniref:esterase-like activity of phytase family protein n=1 Tax=Magnetospirillum sp. LM-5 TaxID=2681466 RepID=UPI001381ED5C|nr:esterase-like activity of phytase family protein [Magnetospirillum sp. LM-5]CAA7622406.1 conserved exported hypothetical protein [Magnetospirillum sp. LM-5]
MRTLLLLLAIFTWLCAGSARAGDDIGLANVPVAPGMDQPPPVGRARIIGLDRLSSPHSWFGGWSGMAWDGDDLVLVSDVGHWARLRPVLAASGRPTALTLLAHGPLGEVGTDKKWGDAEEILRTDQGWAVAFERRHRVWIYPDRLDGPHSALSTPAAMADLAANDGIEAMTILADGRWLLIAEGDEDRPESPAWVGRPGEWRPLRYRHHGLFRPTGAVTLPGGDVVVVERRFTMIGGPALRLVEIKASAIGEDETIGGEELALIQAPLAVDNFESVAVRRRADGRLVALILADDNFNPLQSTLLMTVLLPE